MRIYFGFTVAGDRSAVEAARRIVACLEALGHEVLTRHLISDDARANDRLLGPQAVFERDMAWLRQSQLFIAEASGSSFGIGFEAGYWLASTPHRAILFFRQSASERLSFLIIGNTHPNCTLVPYSSVDEVETFLKAQVGPAALEVEAAATRGAG